MNLIRKTTSRVAVVGLGYVGLPSALLTARSGLRVLGVDILASHIEALSKGESKIDEPGLQELLAKMLRLGSIEFSTKVAPCDIYVIAVPTPVTPDKKADLSYVETAVESLLPHLKKGDLVVIESTVSPGCCRNVVKPILESNGLVCGRDVHLAYCPERVLPGNAVEEIVNNDRVIGGLTPACSALARDFYTAFVKGNIHVAGLEEAELTKLTENAYRDVNIAFANEIANLCEHIGVSPERVIQMANAHPRVNILKPGPGVGGHCIAVDPWFLVEAYPESLLLKSARRVNDLRPKHIIRRVLKHCRKNEKSRVLILGLTYKADVSDLRESPALEIALELANQGLLVKAWEPNVESDNVSLGFEIFPTWSKRAYDEAEIVVLLVDHKEFKQLDWHALGKSSPNKFILCTRDVVPFALRQNCSPTQTDLVDVQVGAYSK